MMPGDLVQRLTAGATLVTPNRRLAQHFKNQFDAARRDAGETVWPSADILPWPAFVARCFEAIAAEREDAPLLLSAEQEAVLWDSAVERAAVERGLLSVTQTAAQCAAAWSLAHAWQLWARVKAVPLSEDARAFVAWAESYEAQCRRAGCLDSARLAAWVGDHLASVNWSRPGTLLLAGFDLSTPAQRALLDAFVQSGTTVEDLPAPSRSGSAVRVACDSADEELSAAARWAEARLAANPNVRIGVVVPDLAQRREAVLRIFAEVLMPGDASADASLAAVDVSLGEPLSDWPLVHDALLLLDAARVRPLPFQHWSALVQSPFLGGAVAESAARARLDALLRESCFAEESLDGFRHALAVAQSRAATPRLVAQLAALSGEVRGAETLRLAPSEWGQRFTQWLTRAGFPGERSLDSVEHQTLTRFKALLEGLSALDRVMPRITLPDALGRVRRLASDTLFQPEVKTFPVQALGILESSGLSFDHLWVCGLTADAWPLAARPNPFLPVTLQREAGIPEASAAAALVVDQRLTEGWLAAAPELVMSHATHDGDRELSPSPLVARLPVAPLHDVSPPVAKSTAERMLAARAVESLVDETAPTWAGTGPLSSGVAALRDQSACPFRAQARHRLMARPLAQPEPGLDAMQRGTLLHAVLQHVWTELKDQDTLFDQDEVALSGLVGRAVAAVIPQHRAALPLRTQPRMAAIESARLLRLTLLWLEVDKERSPFRIETLEDKRVVQAGALPLSVKLDRMDRVLLGDLAGRAVVIDYKTGPAKVSGWDGERLDEPQLPLYLLADPDDIAALAFAQVKLDEMGYKGLAAAEGVARGIRTPAAEDGESDAAAWQRRVDEWRTAITALGNAFVAGHAAVDPKQPKTCSQCDLHMLCRIGDNYGDNYAETVDEEENANGIAAVRGRDE